MKVELKAITKPIDETMSVEDFVAYVARVSNPSNQNNKVTAKKLLKYLRDNFHWSPFEMVHLVIEIETTRDIARQILRHRSFSFQEFSQRYADPTQMEFQVREARLQDTKNRQNSLDTDDKVLKSLWEHYQKGHTQNSIQLYQWAIDNGIAKEQARAVLPEGLTTSKLYMSGSLRSWVHYCHLRMANGTQKEHMEIAKACWFIIVEQFPSLKEEVDLEGLKVGLHQ
jgi:thymidylate synthase (FAD)